MSPSLARRRLTQLALPVTISPRRAAPAPRSATAAHRRALPAPWGPSAASAARWVVLATAGVLLTPAGCSRPTAPRAVAIPGTSEQGIAATVTHDVDGDTIDVALAGGATERVRILGIDTPETVKPNTPVQCYGPQASARTKALVPPGTAVILQRDQDLRDVYGRLLAYVWRRSDGLFLDRSLVADGYARTLSIAPNVAHRVELSAAAASAQARHLGLWGSCGSGQ